MDRLTYSKLNILGNVAFKNCHQEDCDGDCLNCEVQIEAEHKLKEYEDAEEQGLLLRFPITVNDAVDKLFSHNELISLWTEEKEEISYHKRIWYGMAWDIPNELKKCKFVKIFGTIPQSIVHADLINIEVVLSEEAEQALEKMKGE